MSIPTVAVHNHGPEEGRGLLCNETIISDGRPLGACMVRYGIRYTPGTELGRRFPQATGLAGHMMWRTEADADRIRRGCVNATHMEVYEIQGLA